MKSKTSHSPRPLADLNYSAATADARALWSEYLQQPQLYPREVAFRELLRSVKTRLQWFCGSSAEVLFLTCAGTPALECALAALPPDRRILVVRSGYFGERLYQIARQHFTAVQVYDLDFGEPLTVRHEAGLMSAMREHHAHVLVAVHLETSSGILNDLALLGKIGKASQALTLVDGISSLGATECRLADWGIDCFIASVYKALQCPEGLSFIIAEQRYLDAAQRKWSYAFDLERLVTAARQDRYLWMPSVLSLQCLAGELSKIAAQGQNQYFARLRERAAHFRDGLTTKGFKVLGEAQYLSACFTALELPDPKAEAWLECLQQDHHLVLSPGLGAGADRLLRIGHYPRRSEADLNRLITALAATAENLKGS